MSQRLQLMEALGEIGSRDDADVDLAETALMLAALDRPDTDIAPYRDHLADLAEKAHAANGAGASIAMQISALRKLLATEFGYEGDAETYEDMHNANLMYVIDRRKGLPVALGILYLHAARACGSSIFGLNFPSHFLLRIEARGQRAIFDPFNGGRVMTTQDLRQRLKDLQGPEAEITPPHYAIVGNRDILIRLQNNIKLRAVRQGNLERAIDVLHTITLFAPERAELWWELAVLQYQLGNVASAISTLEHYLSRSGEHTEHAEIEDFLRKLRSQHN